ncbi:DnaJ domain-containing protein [Myxococcus sp. RHSTA-1-4]|uniref:DnaJ domain-containing protein n=1 Tax=Myxococcus sp. RHSTA-1-4 TaxID=2874601 RepID=UPI001CBF0857|nr:DnaJ domain-containing protein [Myxococcus sp. RHSTA-1-4]MBZ4415172.1 DnaJ domain-containing protein [Myxococcus sp. RHSTA-1-4]
MAEGEVRQYWVRNDRGTMWGPLTLPTIELLVESGSIKGKLQVSEDGLNFAFPWRFPEVREIFPRALWGDGAPADLAPAAPAISLGPTPGAAPAAVPQTGVPAAGPGAAPIAGPGVAPMAGPGAAPRAGPGAAPMAGPGAAPMAGPGTRPVAGPGARPGPGAAPMAGPGTRPGAPTAGAGTVQRPPPVVAGAAPGAVPGAPVPGTVPGRPPVPPGATGAPHAAVPNPAMRGATAPTHPPGASPVAPPAPVTAAPPTPAPAVVPEDASPFTVPSQGQLEQHSSIRLYGRIAAGEQTGLLSLTLADRTVHIHFRKGNPEFVDSSHPEDALGTSLMGARLLTPEQLQQAESAKDRFGGDLLSTLFGLGLLQPATAFTQLSQRALSILSKGLRAESGTFTFEPRDLPGNKAMPLGNRWAVLSDTVRRLPTVDLRRRLAPVLQLPIMKSGGLVAASELRLTPHEVRALAVIDGVRSVAQLLNDFPQDADHLLRISFLLRELDAVSFAAPSRSAAVSPPPPGASTPPPAAATPPAAAQRPVTAPQAGPAAAQRPPPVVGAAATGAPRPAGVAAPGTAPGAAASAAPPRPAGTAPAAGPGTTASPRPAGTPPVVGPGAAGATPRPAGAPPVVGPGAAGAAPRPAGAPPVVGPGAAGAAPRPAGAPPVVGAAPAAARPPGATPPAAGAAQSRPPPVMTAQAPAAAATPANAPGAEEIPALRQLATAMKQQNHFQRLGLTEQTNSAAVKVAYFRLAKLYHPDTLPPGAPPELEKLKAEVFAYIGDAYRTLTDDKSRAAYIEELKSGGGGSEVDVNSILMAEELFQKSCILVKARKFPEAVKMLDEAIKLNADEAEFYAWRGYARFFTSADKKAAQPEAFREIQNAIKRNERCAPAHYFLGVIAKLCGDPQGALKHFKRTVELQPDHIDAQREIRMASQKK